MRERERDREKERKEERKERKKERKRGVTTYLYTTIQCLVENMRPALHDRERE